MLRVNAGTDVGLESDAPTVRSEPLDAVRGIAVMLVVGYHASFRFPEGAADPVARFLRSVGWIGVDMFFALSGFLIAGILLRSHYRQDVATFFRRRVYRIVPLFLVALVCYLLASVITRHELEILPRLWMTALFLNGWAIPFLGASGVPYTIAWSLSVEEFAYICLGLSALASRRAVIATVFAFLIVAPLIRWTALATGVIEPSLLYYFVPARLDSIALGALGALGLYAPFQRGRLAAAVGVAIVAALMVSFQGLRASGWQLPGIGYLIFGLACGVLVAQLAALPMRQGNPAVTALARMGEVSYFVYLFHMFVLDGVRMASVAAFGRPPPYWPAMAVATTLIYLLARVSWRWFELPLIRRGRGRPAVQRPANEAMNAQR